MNQVRNIKILYLIGSLQIGGAQRHLLQVINRLDRTKFKPYLALLVKEGPLLSEAENLSIPIINLDVRTKLYHYCTLKKILLLAKILRRERINVVHTYLFESDFVGILAAKIARVPVCIISRRSMLFLRNKRHELIVSKIIGHLANNAVAVCEAVKKEIISREGINGEKINVIYNGVDPQIFSGKQTSSVIKKKLNFHNGKVVIGLIATLKPVKDIATFLQAIKIIDGHNNNYTAVIIGDGQLRSDLSNLVKDLELDDKISFMGEYKEISDIYQLIDISVLSSTSEGLSNTILESMVAGKPVVATDVGGNPEVVVNGMTGFLVPPKNPASMAHAIIRLLEDKNMVIKMGQAGRKRVEKYFTIDSMIQKMERLYKNLFN